MQPGIVAHSFNPGTGRQRQVNVFEFKARGVAGQPELHEALFVHRALSPLHVDCFPPGLAAVAAINAAIQKGVAEKTVLELMNPEAQLPQVYPFAADLYQKELATLQQQSPEVS